MKVGDRVKLKWKVGMASNDLHGPEITTDQLHGTVTELREYIAKVRWDEIDFVENIGTKWLEKFEGKEQT